VIRRYPSLQRDFFILASNKSMGLAFLKGSRMLKTIARASRYVIRRGVLFLVNLLAAPSDIMVIQTVRCSLMRIIGFKVGIDSQLSESLYVYDGRRFCAGERCKLGSFCRIWDFSSIIVGSDLLASHGLTLISGTHFLDDARTSRPGPITIGNNVWIGINVTIVGPATIGDNVVIGANSLVLGRLERDGVYAGTPAKLIRKTPAKMEQEHI
jgi:acetyltransferase-like isoleucine patch superfamily enzyme